MSHPPSSVAPVSPVPAIGVELPLAVFDDVSWMRVEQRPPLSFRGQLRRVERQLGGWALCMEAQWLTVGACLVSTSLATSGVVLVVCVQSVHDTWR